MNTLTTDRLVLRWVRAEDAPFLLELLNDPDWLRFVGDRGVRTLAQASDYIRDKFVPHYEQHGFGLWMLVQKLDDRPIGVCGLVRREELDDVDLGFALLPAFRGAGLAREATTACLEHARRELGFRRVLAIATPDNQASAKLLERLGFHFERRLLFSGEELCLYAVEWEN